LYERCLGILAETFVFDWEIGKLDFTKMLKFNEVPDFLVEFLGILQNSDLIN